MWLKSGSSQHPASAKRVCCKRKCFLKESDVSNRKYLVFTSAGENANIKQWMAGDKRIFDICVVNYSDIDNLHKAGADYYYQLKGGKFPNLQKIYLDNRNILDPYDAVWVADDDIIIDTQSINELFITHTEKSLTLLQPSFRATGKVSFPITRQRLLTSLRYTNFVEMTCPVFNTNFLKKFLEVFDPALVGWGTDWWFLNLITEKDKVAISDQVSCINPYDRFKKDGVREIVKLQSDEERLNTWRRIKAERNLHTFKQQVTASVPRNLKMLLPAVPASTVDLAIRIKQKLTQKLV